MADGGEVTPTKQMEDFLAYNSSDSEATTPMMSRQSFNPDGKKRLGGDYDGLANWKIENIKHKVKDFCLTFYLTLISYKNDKPIRKEVSLTLDYNEDTEESAKPMSSKIETFCDQHKITKEVESLTAYAYLQYDNFVLSILCKRNVMRINKLEVKKILRLCQEQIRKKKEKNPDASVEITREMFESVLERQLDALRKNIEEEISFPALYKGVEFDREHLKDILKAFLEENLDHKYALVLAEGHMLIKNKMIEEALIHPSDVVSELLTKSRKLDDEAESNGDSMRNSAVGGNNSGKKKADDEILLDIEKMEKRSQYLDDNLRLKQTNFDYVSGKLNVIRSKNFSKDGREVGSLNPKQEEDIQLTEKIRGEIEKACGYCLEEDDEEEKQ
eukprot:CAMPEP_0115043020 /NCGR_PEP_ID=MMETSP0216-20121206/46612_1 /TAXON_ID=223996 /ORGANISM="Protocruzia adherens, Strain Boccale" /LENGTH=386 /DNA_ID=CAMNT_0002425245 /DNA_START=28 /DNA_END=1188 /DNA_ORIENTATION=+